MSFTGNKWSERLNDLAAMEDGWYEGHGKALTPEALNKADEILHLLDSPNFHVPGIYPLVDEGVIGMEWSEVGESCLVSFQFTEDFMYEVFSMDSKGHQDDDILVETESFEEAMTLLRECLTKARLLTRCETRD
jgi:hypothetical protein